MHEQLDMHSYQSYARLFIKEHKISSQKINKRRATTIKIYSKMKKNMKKHKNNIKMFINTLGPEKLSIWRFLDNKG